MGKTARALRWIAFAALMLQGPAREPGQAVDLRPERLRWSELEYRASKLLLSATSQVELELISSRQAVAELVAAPGRSGLEPRGSRVVLLTLSSKFLGRESEVRGWFDPARGAGLQRTRIEHGKKRSTKTYRFTDEGVLTVRREPGGKSEEQLPPEAWSDSSNSFDPFPPQMQERLVVSEPSVLFYLVAADDLARQGTVRRLYAYSKNRLYLVELTSAGRKSVKVSYLEETSSGPRQRKENLQALRFDVRAQPVDPEADNEDFAFLGLKGDVEIYLEPELRFPVAVRGKAGFIGRVEVKLKRVTLVGSSR